MAQQYRSEKTEGRAEEAAAAASGEGAAARRGEAELGIGGGWLQTFSFGLGLRVHRHFDSAYIGPCPSGQIRQGRQRP